MKHYTLFTTKYSHAFEEYITNTSTHPSEFINKWEKVMIGEVTCFSYSYTRKEKTCVLEEIAHIVSDIVQEEVLKSFTKEYLSKRTALTAKEKKELSNIVLQSHYMNKDQGASYLSYYLIYTPILKSLEFYQELNIEGWIRFKTKQYKRILEDILDQTIYDYETQKDYLNFILLLRENQKIQQPLAGDINLLATNKGQMVLCDSQNQDKTAFYKARYCKELLEEEETTEEDLVLNILITLSPKQIIVHNKNYFQSPRFIETLELVFLTKVTYCEDCALCDSFRQEHPAKDY